MATPYPHLVELKNDPRRPKATFHTPKLHSTHLTSPYTTQRRGGAYLLGCLGAVLGGLRAILGGLAEILGCSWPLFPRSWSVLTRSWRFFGRSWRLLDRSWSLLGRSGCDPDRPGSTASLSLVPLQVPARKVLLCISPNKGLVLLDPVLVALIPWRSSPEIY